MTDRETDQTTPGETPERTGNVIRFPVELRRPPSMTLLRQIRPDARLLFANAENLGFELPRHDARDQTDQATAEHIAAHLAPNERAPGRFLDSLLRPFLTRAVEAARKANDAALAAHRAQQDAARPHAPGWLLERAAELAEHAVRIGLDAYLLAEEAEGVARAVHIARRGEPWRPRNTEADMDILVAAQQARNGR